MGGLTVKGKAGAIEEKRREEKRRKEKKAVFMGSCGKEAEAGGPVEKRRARCSLFVATKRRQRLARPRPGI